MKYIIYTDGSYKSSRKQGGYSIVVCDEEEKVLFFKFKGIKNTSNNRMEISALISALKSVPEESEILIVSDSEYLIKPITLNWLERWKQENFKDKKNVDLWKQIISLLPKYKIEFKWVKGHDNNKLNELADMLAQHASEIDLN